MDPRVWLSHLTLLPEWTPTHQGVPMRQSIIAVPMGAPMDKVREKVLQETEGATVVFVDEPQVEPDGTTLLSVWFSF